MSDSPSFDFWYAVNNTEILLAPTSRLETFGATVLNYHLVTEMLDEVEKVRIREGRVKAARPEIIAPNQVLENMLEGFDDNARQYAEWLRQHEQDLMILRYGFGITNEHVNEHLVTGKLDQISEQVRDTVKEGDDPLAAVVVGVEQPWEVCLLKLMVDVVQQSAPGNMQTLRDHGIRSEADREKIELRKELEADFAAAAMDRRRMDGLATKLKKLDLFAEYEDRFFALVRTHQG